MTLFSWFEVESEFFMKDVKEAKGIDGVKQGSEESVPTWGLLSLIQSYNEGRLTFMEWLSLSRDWSLRMIEQTKGKSVAENWIAKLPPLPASTE